MKTFSGAALKDTICHHPLHRQGYEFDVPVHFGEFVTTETGTGFVHCSPTHGEDDFHLGKKHGIEIPQMVTDDGKYYDHVLLFAGETIYDHKGRKGTANKAVIEALKLITQLSVAIFLSIFVGKGIGPLTCAPVLLAVLTISSVERSRILLSYAFKCILIF